MTLSFRPFNRFSLRVEGAEHVVRMVFHDIIVDPAPLGTAFRPRLDIDVRHSHLPALRLALRDATNLYHQRQTNRLPLAEPAVPPKPAACNSGPRGRLERV